MPELKRIGHHLASSRDLYLLELHSAESLAKIQPVSQYFVVLVIWDVEGVSVNTIASLSQILIDSGCSYMCSWGKDCERMHDIFDEQLTMCNSDSTDSSIVLTTWHDDVLDEALWYFLHLTWPAADYFDASHAGLVITVNASKAHVSRVREVLKQPSTLDGCITDN